MQRTAGLVATQNFAVFMGIIITACIHSTIQEFVQSRDCAAHSQNPETACQSRDCTANLEITQYVCTISRLRKRNLQTQRVGGLA